MLITKVAFRGVDFVSLYGMESATTADYKELYEEKKLKYDALNHEVAQLKKMIFGSRHERFLPEPCRAISSLLIWQLKQ